MDCDSGEKNTNKIFGTKEETSKLDSVTKKKINERVPITNKVKGTFKLATNMF